MNYNHLYYFFVTAKIQNVSRAAELLQISQPSLSSQLKTLENQIGKKLFQKSGRTLKLTNNGEQTFIYCQRMFAAADDLSAYLQSTDNTATRKITIGMSVQIESPFAADLIAEVRQEMTSPPSISVISASTEELAQLLALKKIDLALTNAPLFGEDLVEKAKVRTPVTALISKELAHDLGISARQPLSQILRQEGLHFVLPSAKQKLRHETDQFFQNQKIRKPIAMESDTLSMVTRAAVDGLGLALLPTPYAAEELYHQLLIDLNPKNALWHHTLYLFSRNQQDSTLELIAEEFKSLERNAKFYKRKKGSN